MTAERAQPRTALVLAGGVAKGAFEAAALERLLASGVRFTRVVGASSGALNAIFLASEIYAKRDAAAGAALVTLWRESATWRDFLDVAPRAILRGEGLSTTRKLLAFVRRNVRPHTASADACGEVALRLVVTSARGEPASTRPGALDATTHETVHSFSSEDFADETRLERARCAAVASAALPGLFVPPRLDGHGASFDGGIVNNAPISLALGGEEEERPDRVVIITPMPGVLSRPDAPTLRGVQLATHVLEILVSERLFRDLRAAEARNRALENLDGLVGDKTITSEQRERVLREIGWRHARRIEIVQVRPLVPLPGDALAGFASRQLREVYFAEGRAAADRALDVSRVHEARFRSRAGGRAE